MDKPDKQFKQPELAEESDVRLVVQNEPGGSGSGEGTDDFESVLANSLPSKPSAGNATSPSAGNQQSPSDKKSDQGKHKDKKPAKSIARRVLNLTLFSIGAIVFAVVAFAVNYGIYMQAALNGPDMKALRAATQLAQQNKLTDAEHLLEPFVFSTKNSSHECAKALAVLYAFDNKFDRVDEAVLVISCGDKKKVPGHMQQLGMGLVEQRPEVAAQVLEHAAALQKEVYGEDLQYGINLSCAAHSRLKVGQREQAIKNLQMAVPVLEREAGSANAAKVEAKNLLKELTSSAQKQNEAPQKQNEAAQKQNDTQEGSN